MITMNTTTYYLLLLCARSCANYFAYVISLNPYNNPERKYHDFPHFTDEETGSEWISNLPKVIQLAHGKFHFTYKQKQNGLKELK